jgi:hypothetical protein
MTTLRRLAIKVIDVVTQLAPLLRNHGRRPYVGS